MIETELQPPIVGGRLLEKRRRHTGMFVIRQDRIILIPRFVISAIIVTAAPGKNIPQRQKGSRLPVHVHPSFHVERAVLPELLGQGGGAGRSSEEVVAVREAVASVVAVPAVGGEKVSLRGRRGHHVVSAVGGGEDGIGESGSVGEESEERAAATSDGLGFGLGEGFVVVDHSLKDRPWRWRGRDCIGGGIVVSYGIGVDAADEDFAGGRKSEGEFGGLEFLLDFVGGGGET
mmetsp:Transcript_22152/g.41958  ORF Transcript_22152/g.41958 Transcript_22152/m.41958 type:complete len:232 (+) Transcript_22152:2126-2821(+)